MARSGCPSGSPTDFDKLLGKLAPTDPPISNSGRPRAQSPWRPRVPNRCVARAMPTFVMYKKGRRVDTVRGADPSKLRAMVEKHAPVKGPPAPMGPPEYGGHELSKNGGGGES